MKMESDLISVSKTTLKLRNKPAITGLIMVLVSLAVGIGLGSLFFAEKAPQSAAVHTAVPALTVTSSQAYFAEWPVWVEASGSVSPWQEAVIGPLVTGQRLSEISAEVGDVVSKGQLLAVYESDMLAADEAELKAGLIQAQATLAEAQANRERALAMQSIKALSEQAIQQYVTRAKTAAAQLLSAEARLSSKQLQISYTRVLAPDDGVISGRKATLGSVSQMGQELFRLIRQNRLEWRGEVTAQQVQQLAVGQVVALTLPDGTAAKAVVRKIAPSMDNHSRLATVYADVAAGSNARAEMYVEGRINLSPSMALVIPSESVAIKDGRSYIYLLDNKSKVKTVVQQLVSVGRRFEGSVEILSGLDEGANVVAKGAGFLIDGDVVRVVAHATKSL